MTMTEQLTLNELLNELRGKGWIKATLNFPDHEKIGFELDGHTVMKSTHQQIGWGKLGSWTTGAGNGYTLYRGRVGDYLIDWVNTSSWENATVSAYVAVHEESVNEDGHVPESRNAEKHGWKSNSKRLDQVI